jgi:preprotein translocase subunit SecA
MAQKDPLTEYRSEGHVMFEELSSAIREEVVMTLFHAEIRPEDVDELEEVQRAQAVGDGRLSYEHESLAGADVIATAAGAPAAAAVGAGMTAVATPVGGGGAVATAPRRVSEEEKIGRNDPCWCGSGLKYKKCHGK